MAAAAASLPPPSPFGARDLRANARKFFERALVISALVHLSVVAAVRIVEERAVGHRGSDDITKWEERTFLVPPPLNPTFHWTLTGGPVSQPSVGVFDPVHNRDDIVLPTFGIPNPEPAVPRDGGGGNTDTPSPDPGPGPPTEDGGVFTHADVPPVPVDAPKPPYPDWAREAGVEGKVLLRVLVGADGLPIRVDIVSGPKGLTEEAQKAVQRWRFKPGLSGKIPVKVWVEVPVSFRL